MLIFNCSKSQTARATTDHAANECVCGSLVKYTPQITVTSVFALTNMWAKLCTNLPASLNKISLPLERPHCQYLIATLIITLLR